MGQGTALSSEPGASLGVSAGLGCKGGEESRCLDGSPLLSTDLAPGTHVHPECPSALSSRFASGFCRALALAVTLASSLGPFTVASLGPSAFCGQRLEVALPDHSAVPSDWAGCLCGGPMSTVSLALWLWLPVLTCCPVCQARPGGSQKQGLMSGASG